MPNPEAVLVAAAVAALLAALLLAGLLTALVRWRRRRSRAATTAESATGAAPAAVAAAAPASFRAGLAKTRHLLGDRLGSLLGRDRELGAWLDDLEEALIIADVGVATTQRLLAGVRRRPRLDSPEAVLAALKEETRELMRQEPIEEVDAQPRVILVVGVNGVGKTTTIGKLAHMYQQQGKRVLLVAGDTFRAAAAEQLEIWAKRVGCDLVRHQSGADPSAVAFDGIRAARSRDADVAIIDTAGRLHVKVNLMEELRKVVRVIGREMPGAPHESYLVLDATTGQNALSQARLFREALPLTGLILTKLDGTAKGGAVIAVNSEIGLPVRYVGLGEGLDDLRPFDSDAFVEALFEPEGAEAGTVA